MTADNIAHFLSWQFTSSDKRTMGFDVPALNSFSTCKMVAIAEIISSFRSGCQHRVMYSKITQLTTKTSAIKHSGFDLFFKSSYQLKLRRATSAIDNYKVAANSC
jgi:hypothetical protein